MRLKDINETLKAELQDREYAAAYLQHALEGGTETFMIALRDVAVANGGIAKLAESTSLGRESLYKTLSGERNPRIKTVEAVLEALGYRLTIIKDNSRREE
jgi:probable addiction module antidote protein